MVKGKVIFEDEEKVEIKYPCFELKDVVEYYFEICTPNNSINPFSLVALPNANTLVSIYLSDSSQTFKVHREHGIIDTSGDKISGSLTEAITVIHAPGTHEFSIKFKPGVLYSCLSKGFFVKFGGNLFFISTVFLFFFLNPIKSCRYVCFLVTLKTPHH